MTDLNKELEMEMTAVREKLAFKMERSELALQKLLEHFIHPITCLPFTICKISQPDDIVYSLRQYILDTDVTLPHNSIENYVCITDDRTIRNRIREKEWRGLEEEGMKEKLKMTRAKEQPIANFSESINYKNADSNLGIQLKQMLRKYTLRKMKLEEREKKWKVIHSEKPDTSINHKHDVLIMEESEKTIGDYKLKTLSTFNLLEERDISFSKYKELLNCWKKLYYLQEAFNAKLKTVRTKKEYLHTKVLRLRKDLKNIHVEIPLQSTKCLPTIPTSNINIEYPEKKVMVRIYIFYYLLYVLGRYCGLVVVC
ncbi:hypothetical protein DMN91_008016 [Ooceraea biroi]|uniref:Uncharacterized protein n=1 Tax=Ooceraea biroi TaxID=2015173 RepID=A0A3L8DHR8_OOCBI|nr:hypothetical protein DMN91_008016 [Ooceraea biroi]